MLHPSTRQNQIRQLNFAVAGKYDKLSQFKVQMAVFRPRPSRFLNLAGWSNNLGRVPFHHVDGMAVRHREKLGLFSSVGQSIFRSVRYEIFYTVILPCVGGSQETRRCIAYFIKPMNMSFAETFNKTNIFLSLIEYER